LTAFAPRRDFTRTDPPRCVGRICPFRRFSHCSVGSPTHHGDLPAFVPFSRLLFLALPLTRVPIFLSLFSFELTRRRHSFLVDLGRFGDRIVRCPSLWYFWSLHRNVTSRNAIESARIALVDNCVFSYLFLHERWIGSCPVPSCFPWGSIAFSITALTRSRCYAFLQIPRFRAL